MKKEFNFVKINLKSYFALGDILEGVKSSSREKTKFLSYLLAIGFLGVVFIPMIIKLNTFLFNGLAPLGLEKAILTSSVVLSFGISMMFSLLYTINFYYISSDKSIFLSMPIKPYAYLLSSFSLQYIFIYIVSSLIFLPSSYVYGINMNCSIFYYLFALITSFFLPIIPITICFMLMILVTKLGGVLRNKDILMYVSMFASISVILAYQYFITSSISANTGQETIITMLSDKDSIINIVGRGYVPSILIICFRSWRRYFNGRIAT